MKKLFFLTIMAITCFTFSQAQEVYVKQSSDTAANIDTVVLSFTKIGSNVKSLQATVVRLGGAVGGKVYMQGTVDGEYVTYDSLTVTDKAVNTKIWVVSSTDYASYRAYFTSSGTQTSLLRFSYLRRKDEK